VEQCYNIKIKTRLIKVDWERKEPLKLTSCKEMKTILDQRQRNALRREKKM
jgi:hypothetical protein